MLYKALKEQRINKLHYLSNLVWGHKIHQHMTLNVKLSIVGQIFS